MACISSWATVPVVMQLGFCRFTWLYVLSKLRPTYDQHPVSLLSMVIKLACVVLGMNRTHVLSVYCCIACRMIVFSAAAKNKYV